MTAIRRGRQLLIATIAASATFSFSTSRAEFAPYTKLDRVVSDEEARFGIALAVADFNGSGRADLAIGSPGDRHPFDLTIEPGVVHTFYPEPGLFPVAYVHSTMMQDIWYFHGDREYYDRLGETLAAGDFNGDGLADLAIGIPHEDVLKSGDTIETLDAGAVSIVYGGRDDFWGHGGLGTPGMQTFTQGSSGFVGGIEAGDKIGEALVSGDFNCDGFADLAIGAPDEDIDTGGLFETTDAGAVYVLYGSASGLRTSGMQIWTQDSAGVSGSVENGDHFGAALATGDFNGDHCDDLAIGVPDEDIKRSGDLFETSDAGYVHVLYGGSGGIRSSGSQAFHQDSSGFPGIVEKNDHMGTALAAGDFNGDGVDELVIGVPGEDVGSPVITDAGVAYVLRGQTGSGLTASGAPAFGPNSSPAGASYGSALDTGDFNGDGRADLAVGAPGENVMGRVYVLYSNGSWPSTSGMYAVSLGNSNDPSRFGAALASGDLDCNGTDDLVVGAPHRTDPIRRQGEVYVLFSEPPQTGDFRDGFEAPGECTSAR